MGQLPLQTPQGLRVSKPSAILTHLGRWGLYLCSWEILNYYINFYTFEKKSLLLPLTSNTLQSLFNCQKGFSCSLLSSSKSCQKSKWFSQLRGGKWTKKNKTQCKSISVKWCIKPLHWTRLCSDSKVSVLTFSFPHIHVRSSSFVEKDHS